MTALFDSNGIAEPDAYPLPTTVEEIERDEFRRAWAGVPATRIGDRHIGQKVWLRCECTLTSYTRETFSGASFLIVSGFGAFHNQHPMMHREAYRYTDLVLLARAEVS